MVAAVFVVECSCRDLPVCVLWHAFKRISFTLEPACRSSWEKSRDLPTIYQLKDSGKANGELAAFIFLGIACGLPGFVILKLRWYVLLLLFAAVLPVVLAKTSLLPDTRLCLCFYAGTLLEIKLHDENKEGET
ncbi:MAG: hypothetical protein ACLU9T_18060 [Blautia faecis]